MLKLARMGHPVRRAALPRRVTQTFAPVIMFSLIAIIYGAIVALDPT
jgi:hypothetical protein